VAPDFHTPQRVPARNDFVDDRKKSPALWISQRESFPELKY